MCRIGDLGRQRVVVFRIGPVGIVAVPEVRPADGVAGAEVVIDLARDVVVELVVALIEAVAARVAAVADVGVIDSVRSGHLPEQRLDGGVDGGKAAQSQ